MYTVTQLVISEQPADKTLTLPFEKRQKSRFRATLDSGESVAVILPRGTALRDGDRLATEEGAMILVQAAKEQVSTASSTEAQLLCCAAYHLGNRHVPVQIEAHRLRYGRDHVLDEMLRRLGLQVIHEFVSFEAEPGAYGYQSHSH